MWNILFCMSNCNNCFEKYLNLNANSYRINLDTKNTLNQNTLSIFISQSGETADASGFKICKKTAVKYLVLSTIQR